MFDTASIGHEVDKATWKKEEPKLRQALLAAIDDRLAEGAASTSSTNAPPLLPPIDGRNVIRALDLKQKLGDERYEQQLEKWQGRLALLSRDEKFKKVSVVCVFEGNDAAGKGGAIRRITATFDARLIRPIPIAAPTEEERAVCDMIDRTSTEEAPWTLVEANDKNFARVKVMKTLVRAVEERFDSM